METITTLTAIIALIAGFLLAWLLENKNFNNQRTIFEIAQKKLQDERNMFENQHLITQETLRIKSSDLEKLQVEFDEINYLADNRGMELAAVQNANANLLQQGENI